MAPFIRTPLRLLALVGLTVPVPLAAACLVFTGFNNTLHSLRRPRDSGAPVAVGRSLASFVSASVRRIPTSSWSSRPSLPISRQGCSWPSSPDSQPRWLKRVRAARWLAQSRDTIADIALRAGFADQSHLGRVLKRSIGLTPARFRAVMQMPTKNDPDHRD